MARIVGKIDVVNLEPTKTFIQEIERVIEIKANGASYKHAYRLLMAEYEVFKNAVRERVDRRHGDND